MTKPPITPTRSQIIRRALADVLPLFIPAIPFALVLGIAIVQSSVPTLLGWSSSWVIYGGASQLTLLSLLDEGVAAAAAVTAALIVNARHLMYSAALAPAFQGQPVWFRWLGPYFLVDQVFVLAMQNTREDPRVFREYYLGVGVSFWLLWLIATSIALFVGPAVPPDWELGFAVPILFTGLLVMGIEHWTKLVAALVAGSIAYLGAELPHRSGLLLGALAGILAGALAGWRRR